MAEPAPVVAVVPPADPPADPKASDAGRVLAERRAELAAATPPGPVTPQDLHDLERSVKASVLEELRARPAPPAPAPPPLTPPLVERSKGSAVGGIVAGVVLLVVLLALAALGTRQK